MSQIHCKDCRFWQPFEDDDDQPPATGCCRRRAPLPTVSEFDMAKAIWAETCAEDWCGEAEVAADWPEADDGGAGEVSER